ncbi:hypothetical protein BJ508DRAFT_418228 [Ascobolus immersus RN42]|uniref:Purine and uridine phosphorylase n=1 Tax=Ascobolus immersus RN42 TaxID=1160509 RepID=A0A3N4HN35_ASCIM|nr:hypothetical protein BJ508DRAFT_418228 [Ascobolus immersus RN42]
MVLPVDNTSSSDNIQFDEELLTNESPHNNDQYTIGWICAIPVEQKAACLVLDKIHGKPKSVHSTDRNVYCLGEIDGHFIVIPILPKMGNLSSGRVARDMLLTFKKLRLGLMVGVGGGVPGTKTDVRLGDVVVSVPSGSVPAVIPIDNGKREKDGFKQGGGLPQPDDTLLAAANLLRWRKKTRDLLNLAKRNDNLQEEDRKNFLHQGQHNDVLYPFDYDHPGPSDIACKTFCDQEKAVQRDPRPNNNPVVHFGAVGSGNSVIKHGKERERLRKQFEILCVEMEAAGIMNELRCLVIRGICDYCDSHKNKIWQPYAALMAATMAKEVIRVLSKSESESASTDVPAWKRVSYTPFKERNYNFVGRSKLLDLVETKLFADFGKQCSKTALVGLGGVGKTQIANEIFYRTLQRHPACSVFWVVGTSSEAFTQSYREIARLLEIPGIDNLDAGNDICLIVKRRLEEDTNGRWLMILDNADDSELWSVPGTVSLKQFLPFNKHGALLATTRDRQAARSLAPRDSDVIDVDQMEEIDAHCLLMRRLSRPIAKKTSDSEVRQLLKPLCFLPLAIVQAASFINLNEISVTAYLKVYSDADSDSGKTSVLKLLQDNFNEEGRYPDQDNAVATTWLVSFEQIQKRSPEAIRLLAMLACLSIRPGADGIPSYFLPQIARECGQVGTLTVQTISDIGLLKRFSFVQELKTVSTNECYCTEAPADDVVFYSMHRLVGLATRNWVHSRSNSLLNFHDMTRDLATAVLKSPHSFSKGHPERNLRNSRERSARYIYSNARKPGPGLSGIAYGMKYMVRNPTWDPGDSEKKYRRDELLDSHFPTSTSSCEDDSNHPRKHVLPVPEEGHISEPVITSSLRRDHQKSIAVKFCSWVTIKEETYRHLQENSKRVQWLKEVRTTISPEGVKEVDALYDSLRRLLEQRNEDTEETRRSRSIEMVGGLLVSFSEVDGWLTERVSLSTISGNCAKFILDKYDNIACLIGSKVSYSDRVFSRIMKTFVFGAIVALGKATGTFPLHWLVPVTLVLLFFHYISDIIVLRARRQAEKRKEEQDECARLLVGGDERTPTEDKNKERQ